MREDAFRIASARFPGLPVAVLGSAGFGDATAASDLDLWVVREGPPAVERFFDRDLPVTAFCEPRALCADPAHLRRVEAEHAFPLSHPGLFEGFATHVDRAAERVLRERQAWTARAQLAAFGAAREALLGARHGAWSLGKIAARIHSGRRVVKARHVKAALPALFDELEAAQGCGDASTLLRRAQAAWPSLALELGRFGLPPPEPLSPALEKKAPADAISRLDVVLSLRRSLHEGWASPLAIAVPGTSPLALIDGAPAELATLFSDVWDLAHTEPELARLAASARAVADRIAC